MDHECIAESGGESARVEVALRYGEASLSLIRRVFLAASLVWLPFRGRRASSAGHANRRPAARDPSWLDAYREPAARLIGEATRTRLPGAAWRC